VEEMSKSLVNALTKVTEAVTKMDERLKAVEATPAGAPPRKFNDGPIDSMSLKETLKALNPEKAEVLSSAVVEEALRKVYEARG
jgi:hypothetical protein